MPAQDIAAGAYALLCAGPYLPAGSVVCAVVDPGVGTSRRAIALELQLPGRQLFLVAPDNGLATSLLAMATHTKAVTLDNPAYQLSSVGTTFHGRDVFAPVAAHLASGVRLEQLGTPLASAELVRLDRPDPEQIAAGWRGEVLHIDRFGNLITNLPGALIDDQGGWRLQVTGSPAVPVGATFGDAAAGEAIAYVGSIGQLELAVRDGNAATSFGSVVGTRAWLIRSG